MHVNISNTSFNQRSQITPEEGVLNCHRHTDRHTDGHGNSMTELAEWGRFSENKLKQIIRESETKLKLFATEKHTYNRKYFAGINAFFEACPEGEASTGWPIPLLLLQYLVIARY